MYTYYIPSVYSHNTYDLFATNYTDLYKCPVKKNSIHYHSYRPKYDKLNGQQHLGSKEGNKNNSTVIQYRRWILNKSKQNIA